MRVWIAEKPDQARAIADVLPAPMVGNTGYFKCANDDFVTWCRGHMYQLAEPEEYDPEFRRWSFDTLRALIPNDANDWKYVVKDGNRKQLETIQALVRQADAIVHCGDYDREGQRIVDKVLIESGVDPAGVQRLLVRALDPKTVRTAIADLQPNAQFLSMGEAAAARAIADYAIGIPNTRVYTLLARAAGYGRTISVGRVKTPTLNLVVMREREIERFIPVSYYRVAALVKHESKGDFVVEWIPAENTDGIDEKGRVLDQKVARDVGAAVSGVDGEVVGCENETDSAAPPLPHDLTSVTHEANRRWHLTAGQIKTILQNLYDRHKLISYPRTECRHLPENQHGDAPEVLEAVKDNASQLHGFVQQANPQHISSAWDGSKVGTHHGIIPTAHTIDMNALTENERNIYDLIARTYVAQFYPDSTAATTTVIVNLGGYNFQARSRELTSSGWRVLFDTPEKLAKLSTPKLPVLEPADLVHCVQAESSQHQTSPPDRYTDGTLMQAMKNISKHIEDKEERASLDSADGIGTSATRSTIIEELVSFGLMQRNERYQIVPTKTGRDHIDVAPAELKSPALTARYEQSFKRIEKREDSLDRFLKQAVDDSFGMVDYAIAHPIKPLLGKHKPKRAQRPSLAAAGAVGDAIGQRTKPTLARPPAP
jgi:DNA topoisomerase-3